MFPTRKPLQREEEKALVLQAQAGNRAAEERLIYQWGRLAINTALRASRRFSEGVDIEDLIGWGILGVVLGIRAYDPERGVRLSTCLYLWVKEYVQKGLRSHRFIHLPSDSLRVYYSLLFILGRENIDMTTEAGWEKVLPLVQEVASPRRPLTVDRLKEIYRVASSSQTFHLESDESHRGSYDTRENFHPFDTIAAPTSLEDENIEALKQAVEELTMREQEILRNLYGLGNSECLTLNEVGSKFCISRQRVAQIENRVLLRLRSLLGNKVQM